MKRRYFLPLIFLFCSSDSFAQSASTQDAFDRWLHNDRAAARLQFGTILQKDPNNTDALLAMTVIEEEDGHYDEAATQFRKFFRAHSEPYPYLYAMWNKGILVPRTREGKDSLLVFLNRILKDPRANVTMKARAESHLAGLLKDRNDIPGSRDMYNRIGDVRNWSTVGVFENVSASGYGKDFGPLEHPEPDFTFANNIGCQVKWFPIPDARNDRWLDMEYHYDVSNAIIYAQTFLRSDEARDVTALLGVSGSVKLWVNDFLVGSESEERNTDFDVFSWNVKLKAGTNRILIQLGSSEIERSNFLLRFQDASGQILSNLTTTQTYSPYQKADPYPVVPNRFFAEKYFEDRTGGTTPGTFLDRLMLAYVYAFNDDRYAYRRVTKQLKKDWPGATTVSRELIEANNRDNNQTDLTREIEFIKTNDPDNLLSLEYRYDEAFNKEQYDDAAALLNRRVELYGRNEATELLRIRLLAKKNDVERMLGALDSNYAKFPDNAAFAAMEYRLQKDAFKNNSKAVSILEKYLRNNYNEDFSTALVDEKISQNKKEEGFGIYKKLISDKPYSTASYSKLADKYFQSHDYKSSALWMDKAIERAPYVGGLYYSKGMIVDAAGQKGEAISCFEKAIHFSPTNYEARRKLQELKGKKDIFKNFRENDIAEIYKSSPTPAEYPNDNSIYLLKEMQQVIYPENGASEERNELVVKIFNTGGIDDWKQVTINYNNYSQRLIIDKSEILKKDGSRVQADNNDGQIVFSSLEVGDAIHVSYRLENAFTGKLSEHFWEDFTFNSNYPVKLARYSVVVPTARKFRYKTYNANLSPVVTDLPDDYRLYVWESRDNAKVETESHMPAFDDIAARVVVSSIPDWNYVADWYNDLSNVKLKADFEIREKLSELMAGHEKSGDLEKARLIYHFIEKNFSYSNVPFLHSAFTPQRASRTLNARLGDCKDLSVLFCSMARQAGLDASLVLVQTRNESDFTADLPQIFFNHCIARLNADGKTYFIELTDNDLPFSAMGNYLNGANALLVPVTGAHAPVALTRINGGETLPNTLERSATIRLNGNNAEIVRSTVYSGSETSGVRSEYRNESEEDRKKSLKKSLSSDFNGAVSLKDMTIDNLDTLAGKVNFSYRFTADNFISEVAGMKLVKLPWRDHYNSLEFVALEKRKFPMALWSVSSTPFDRETLTLYFPAGRKLVEIPKNLSFACPALSYALTYQVKADRLIITREVKYLKPYVSPEEYPAFRETVMRMSDADQQQMAFK